MCQVQTNGNYPGAPPVFELDEEGEPVDGEEEEVLRRKFEEVCVSRAKQSKGAAAFTLCREYVCTLFVV